MDEQDRVFARLKTPIYEEINESLKKLGIITADIADEWLRENGYNWTYDDFLRERKSRIFKNFIKG